MPKAKNDVQNMSINDGLQKISVKMTFYFNISNSQFWTFFENYLPTKFFVRRKKFETYFYVNLRFVQFLNQSNFEELQTKSWENFI